MKTDNSRIQLLDCTLRDGGFGLEDAVKNHLSDKVFDLGDIQSMLKLLKKTKIDIIEIGAIEISEQDKSEFAIRQCMEDISASIPGKYGDPQKYAALYRGPDTPLEDIPEWKPDYCECVRVILRYSELQKSLDFCSGLADKGYKVFVQPMLTMRYSDEELHKLVDAANTMQAYALYFVDSYGYMNTEDIARLFHFYDRDLDQNIRIGFHAHNNMNLAFANAVYFLKVPTDRKIILDSCITGMGQGAGNLQTGIIADYLNKNNDKEYDYDAVLDLCEIMEKYLTSNLWGYSVTRLLPALYKTAYKYAVSFRNTYHLSYVEINHIMQTIPNDLRQRYTPESAELLVANYRRQ